jgi:U3 small nucleolar RNA-associated protein 18
VKRLRLQFALLHPSPDWVRHLPSHDSNSGVDKSKRVATEERISLDGDEDTDTDTEDAQSLPPLGRILQNTEGLTVDHNSAQAGRRGLLRQGVLDIQRLKDVWGNQPVSKTTSIVYSGTTTVDFCRANALC